MAKIMFWKNGLSFSWKKAILKETTVHVIVKGKYCFEEESWNEDRGDNIFGRWRRIIDGKDLDAKGNAEDAAADLPWHDRTYRTV